MTSLSSLAKLSAAAAATALLAGCSTTQYTVEQVQNKSRYNEDLSLACNYARLFGMEQVKDVLPEKTVDRRQNVAADVATGTALGMFNQGSFGGSTSTAGFGAAMGVSLIRSVAAQNEIQNHSHFFGWREFGLNDKGEFTLNGKDIVDYSAGMIAKQLESRGFRVTNTGLVTSSFLGVKVSLFSYVFDKEGTVCTMPSETDKTKLFDAAPCKFYFVMQAPITAGRWIPDGRKTQPIPEWTGAKETGDNVAWIRDFKIQFHAEDWLRAKGIWTDEDWVGVSKQTTDKWGLYFFNKNGMPFVAFNGEVYGFFMPEKVAEEKRKSVVSDTLKNILLPW